MELVPTRRLQLYSGRTHLPLAEAIAAHLGIELGESNLHDFPNSETHCRFGESIRGADVFILQSHYDPVNQSIMEQLIMIDAAKRASAKRITAVCPYYGYGRQDRKASGREPIAAKMIADMMTTAGADRIVAVDLHSGQIQGFFDGPFDHLIALPLMIGWLKANAPKDIVVAAPDVGRSKVAERIAIELDADVAVVDKRRNPHTGETEFRGVLGDVAGRPCVLVDDEISTAGTICGAAEQLSAHGATEVWAMATHAVLAGPAIDRLKNSAFTKIVVTDTLPIPSEKMIDKIEVVSVAKTIADAIDAVFEDASVSELFGGKNQS